MLILGAGATIEECLRSGSYPDDPERRMPTIRDFCAKLFQRDSNVLLQATASYLIERGIAFEPKLLHFGVNDTYTGEDIRQSPIGVFLQLESQFPLEHNIETLCEHVWRKFGSALSFWSDFTYSGIFLKLFVLFTEQFGLGAFRPMKAGSLVAGRLSEGDTVINLNYDIAFDAALEQINANVCYAPHFCERAINVLKPHGSINLYVNLQNGNFFFERPSQLLGSVGIPDNDGGTFFPHDGIVPPRLNKTYQQHPIARMILNTLEDLSPTVLTFWGVGLTPSDFDLLNIYRQVAQTATTIEYINPSAEAYENASTLLGREVRHFRSLDDWLSQ